MDKYYNFIYMKNRDFVFAYIPKVACTNWKCLLRFMSGYENYLDNQIAHDRKYCGLTFVSDIKENSFFISDRNIKKYSFVRNPFSRILSAYLNKVELFVKNPEKSSWDQHFFNLTNEINEWRLVNLPSEPELNYFCFLMWIKYSEHIHSQNEHWLPQTSLLHLDEVSFDYIGRFENIAKDAPHLLKLMNCDLPFPTQDDVKFQPHNASAKLAQYYGEREIEIIRDLYCDDFDLLNYTTDLP